MFAYDTEINLKYQATGISSAMLSNRLSWFYNLQGSSVSIDTACSSSLVGLHLACQNLLQGESDMVRLINPPTRLSLKTVEMLT